MDRTGVNQDKNDLKALRALQADAQELERIAKLLDRFNVFETIGFVKDELMHSNFLASLLDPRQNHGFGDMFLRRLLDGASLLNSLDLREMDLAQTLVHREWQYVDILLTNETHGFALIIENKVWSSERVGQLDWYRRIVSGHHPGWQVGSIYLTPQGDAPSHDDYLPLSYETVCKMLEEALEDRGSAVSPDVRVSIEHYVGMVRRRILGDPELVMLCQQVYLKHKRAFDLIYRYRPDLRVPIRSVVEGLIGEHPTTNPRSGASPRFLRWYAEDRPACPAPITTMSVLSATRNVGGSVEVGRGGLGILVSCEEFSVLIVMHSL